MAVAFGPTSCPSGLVPKSKLLHRPETQYGFVPKHSLHGGKNIALRAKKQKNGRQEYKKTRRHEDKKTRRQEDEKTRRPVGGINPL